MFLGGCIGLGLFGRCQSHTHTHTRARTHNVVLLNVGRRRSIGMLVRVARDQPTQAAAAAAAIHRRVLIDGYVQLLTPIE
jgi:hypothetical protein